MVSFLVSKVVDHGFIGGVMVSVLVSKAVDRGFICGVMVNVLRTLTFYTTMKPRSTAFKKRMLTRHR
jgi:hypothetical protein